MRKILVLTSSFPTSAKGTKGGGRFILRLCQEIKTEYEPVIVAPKFYNSTNQEFINGVEVQRFGFLPVSKLYNYFNDGIFQGFKRHLWLFPFLIVFMIKQILISKKLIKRYDIKIIHAHWIYPQGLSAVIIKRLLIKKNIKIIITSHGGDIFSFNNKIGNYLKKRILKQADIITVVSNYIKKFITEKLKIFRELYVAPMGIDTLQFTPKRYNQGIRDTYKIKGNFLLFVGRLTEKKGVKYLIEAMPHIINKHPDTKLLIIGSGPEEVLLKKQARQLNMINYIVFTGALKYDLLPTYYATADIFIGPSVIAKGGDSEGFGLVFAEAASSGCLVVTTDFPAMRDIIINEETGFLVPQRDTNAIFGKINFLLDNKNQWGKIKYNARSYIVENFDWVIVRNNYEIVLNKLV